MNDHLYTTSEISALLHVGKSTIKRWTEEGKLKCFRTPGGHRKFKADFLIDFIQTYNFDVPIPALSKIEHDNDNSMEPTQVELHSQIAVG